MNALEFEISEEFIPLSALLKVTGLAMTGGHAKVMISNGEVSVNGEDEFRIRRKMRVGDKVQINGEEAILITGKKIG
jgi:ribosome-associated protein